MTINTNPFILFLSAAAVVARVSWSRSELIFLTNQSQQVKKITNNKWRCDDSFFFFSTGWHLFWTAGCEAEAYLHCPHKSHKHTPKFHTLADSCELDVDTHTGLRSHSRTNILLGPDVTNLPNSERFTDTSFGRLTFRNFFGNMQLISDLQRHFSLNG